MKKPTEFSSLFESPKSLQQPGKKAPAHPKQESVQPKPSEKFPSVKAIFSDAELAKDPFEQANTR